MTLVEAMRCGVPVVSTDCPLGPAEIIQDGVDGRLVPVGDVPAFTEALLQLIEDEPGRRTMGATARENAARFDPVRIAGQYEELFAALEATRTERARARWRGTARRGLRDLLRRTLLLGVARRTVRLLRGGRRQDPA